jgi:hypothetical protein
MSAMLIMQKIIIIIIIIINLWKHHSGGLIPVTEMIFTLSYTMPCLGKRIISCFMDAILFPIEIYLIDTKIEGYALDGRLGGPQSRSEIIIIILYYLYAESTATRPIRDTAQCRYR